MNIDEHPQIAGQLGIQSIPAVFAFSKGQPVDGFMGALPESQIKGFIERLVGPLGPAAAEDLLAEAEALAAEATSAGAAELYAARAGAGPGERGRARRARPAAARRSAISRAPSASSPWSRRPGERPRASPAARAAIELAEQAASLGDLGRPEAAGRGRPARSSGALRSGARAERAAAEREEAVDQLLEIVRRDRSWNEDGARKQLVQFFEAWGPTDEARSPGGASSRRSCSPDGRRRAGVAQHGHERAPIRARRICPAVIPVFPLAGALLLPRGQMPLNIFEPRYLAMVDDALRARPPHRHDPARRRGRRQRDGAAALPGRLRRPHHAVRRDRRRTLPDHADRRRAASASRRSSPSRPRSAMPRRLRAFAADFRPGPARTRSTAPAVLKSLRDFVEANDLKVDWHGIEQAPNEALVNAL